MENENNVGQPQIIKERKKTQYSSVEVVILMISTAVICFIAGGFLVLRFDKTFKINSKEDIIEGEISEFEKAYDYIIDNYYGRIDKEKLIENAISGMLDSLEDANSTYISEENSNNFNALLDGSYQGIGVEITSDGTNITIVTVFENTPASKAGLKEKDIIVSINGTSTEGLSTLEVVNTIKEKNQNVELTIKRDGVIMQKTLKTENVILDSVTSKVIEKKGKKIGYIYMSIFAVNTYDQFKQQLESLEKQNIDSLIIDVRSNSGGHLTTASKILSLFLGSDKVIYQMKNNNGITKYYSQGIETKTYPIVVLVNKESASASEILSSALKEQYGATLVGEKTYGKGTVQELKSTDSGLQYKITTQHWLTSKGMWIDGTGVPVDYEVSLTQDFYKNPTDENDTQLQKAIDILK